MDILNMENSHCRPKTAWHIHKISQFMALLPRSLYRPISSANLKCSSVWYDYDIIHMAWSRYKKILKYAHLSVIK